MGKITVRRPKVQDVRNWVEALGVLTCDNMTPTEAEMKTLAYVPMLQAEFPPEAFTQESLSAVARQCKFFPSYAEVYCHLRDFWRERRPIPIALPEPLPAPRPEPTPEERARVHEQLQELVQSLRAKALYQTGGNNELSTDHERRPRAHYLTPEQLDIVNPLPGGRRRVPELLK